MGGKRRRKGGKWRGGRRRQEGGPEVECVCRERNVWNPNCVIAAEQTLVLPVIPQTAGSECVSECVCEYVRQKKRRGGRKLNESGKLRVKPRV